MTDRINVIEEHPRPYISGVHVDYLTLPDRELKIWLALKSFAWNQKENCFPTIGKLCEITDKGRRQVTEILGVLEKKGLIRIERHTGYANNYIITNIELKNEQDKLSTEKGTPSKKPMRKSTHPMRGKPHNPHAGIRTQSNISNKKKEKEKKKSVFCLPENQKRQAPATSIQRDTRAEDAKSWKRGSSAIAKQCLEGMRAKPVETHTKQHAVEAMRKLAEKLGKELNSDIANR